MKTKRQVKILELIAKEEIGTQEQLLALLNESGFSATQATISRDIRELKLLKFQSSDGTYRYMTAKRDTATGSIQRFNTIMSEALISAQAAQNIVVVRCHTGMANAACEVLDSLELEEVVGTLAGDNTFLAVTHDSEDAKKLARRLTKSIPGR